MTDIQDQINHWRSVITDAEAKIVELQANPNALGHDMRQSPYLPNSRTKLCIICGCYEGSVTARKECEGAAEGTELGGETNVPRN